MATKPKEEEETPSKPAAAKSRPDLATFIGIALAFAGIVGGLLLEHGSIMDVAQETSALIVLGGTIGAVLVNSPLSVFIKAVKALKGIFFEQAGSSGDTVEMLIRFASMARKSGIVSLESEASSIPDPFVRKAMNLAVDGADLQELRNIMEIDIQVSQQQGEAEIKVWESAGGYAPTIGIIGAVLGLIQVMKHLEDITVVGHGIAGAFVATVYGVAVANIFFLPAAAKLKARLHDRIAEKEMALEGIAGIAQGLNPTLIRMKLESYNHAPAPKKAKAEEAEGKAGAPEPAAARG